MIPPLPLADAHSPPAAEPTTHPGAQWFPEAGLGLFVHWGIAAVHGGLDLSWRMIRDNPWCRPHEPDPVTPAAHWRFADRFNPDAHDPDRWLAAARNAGFRDAVLSTRHHDDHTL